MMFIQPQQILIGFCVAASLWGLCLGVQLSKSDAGFTNAFEEEKGGLDMQWKFTQVNGEDHIDMQVTLDGDAWIGVGFGGSMFNTDMILAWVDGKGVHAQDMYSTGHQLPSLDTSLGGMNDVTAVSGFVKGGRTTVRFRRALDTGDKFDTVLSKKGDTDMIYAWGNGRPGDIRFHADSHNHIMIDLSRGNGVPKDSFGREETGLGARQIINSERVGTLVTMQNEINAGKPNLGPWPYGSVASFADEEPSTGKPIILLSTLERNIINTETDSRASLAVHTTNATEPMSAPRTTLLGKLEKIPDAELAKARKTYLAKHPDAEMWIDFGDFSLYRMQVIDVYWVGGFGNDHYIGAVSASAYLDMELSAV